MTATHAYVVTSSLYVHNLLNQVRHDDSIMNDAVWLPKANDYESDSKSCMMIGTYGFTLQVHSRMSRLSWTSKLFSLSTLSLSSRGISCFFFSMEFNPIRNTNVVVLYTHCRTKTWLNNDVHLICRTRRILRNL